MAFNLIAESSGELAWTELSDVIRALAPDLECFPIPAPAETKGDALGISIPSGVHTSVAWQELERLVKTLRDRFHLTITELYSGSAVDDNSLPQLRALLQGPS